MQFFLDTANVDYVRKGVFWGIGNGFMAAG